MAMKLYPSLSLFFLFQLACAGEGERYADAELVEAQRVYWSDVAPIFEIECKGCHDDPPKLGAPQALRTYEEILPWLNRIQVRSLEIGDMPPGGLRTLGAKTLIQKWIDQGALEQSIEAGEMAGEMAGEIAGEIPNTIPTWENDIFSIFEVYCNTCHANPPTGGAPFSLKTYQDALPYLERFRERVINLRDMPPEGINDELVIEQLTLWIKAGGPE